MANALHFSIWCDGPGQKKSDFFLKLATTRPIQRMYLEKMFRKTVLSNSGYSE